MRKFILVLTAAALAGCNSSGFPTWRPPWRTGDTTPVSKPTEALPAENPAPTPAATPAEAPAAPAAPVAAAPTPIPLTDLAQPKPEPAATPEPAPKPEPEMVTAPEPVVNAPPKPAQPGRAVMAYVNGEPIYMDQLNQLLISGYGMVVAQQLVANELVRQEAQRKGLTVTDAEVEAQHQRYMDALFPGVTDANQRQRLLEQLLKKNNVSQDQWNLTMRRNTLLAKLADNQVQVAEEEVKEEFDRQYERKVRVQHIQTASLADAQKVLKDLAEGAEFTALVNKYSIGPTADKAGLLEPFGAKDTGTPPALRQVAMGMKKVGEVSDPIQVGTAFHILKLLAIIEPENVKYEDVRARLAADVRKRKAVALQQDILQILIRGGKLQYVDPILKSQADRGQ
jgi:foldase protein PrsA